MRRVLKPGGRLVVGDILRPEVGAAADVTALLKLAAKNGFLSDALWGLARTALSDYWQLRQSIGLQRYSATDMIAKLNAAGFTASLAKTNVGYNPARMTFVATAGT
jgi:ubiquinone/menaquinone biosynthesis C-methylase UbiE